MKQAHRSYSLEAYDPSWPNRFADLKSQLEPIFVDALKIEHIGSTSIPGMVAKPQIDILVEVPDLEAVRAKYQQMEKLGFTPRGDYGGILKAEEYFTKDSESGEREVSVHVYETGNPKIPVRLNFRNYLREDANARKAYIERKQQLLKQFSGDYPAYNRGKADLIEELNAQAAEWARSSH